MKTLAWKVEQLAAEGALTAQGVVDPALEVGDELLARPHEPALGTIPDSSLRSTIQRSIISRGVFKRGAAPYLGLGLTCAV